MTDGPDHIRFLPERASVPTVESLATRAIAVLASKRVNGPPALIEALVVGLMRAARGEPGTDMSSAILDLRHSGITADDIVDLYVPEAARRFGDAWVSDGIGFADVTIAVARLQRALRDLSQRPANTAHARNAVHSVLVVVVPDEFHTLGPMVMTEQFRRAGLSVRLRMGDNERDVLRTIANGRFDAILFSVGGSEKLASARRLVEKSREALSKKTPIVVGGAVMTSGLDIKSLTGADFSSSDPQEALRLCGLKTSLQGARPSATSD